LFAAISTLFDPTSFDLAVIVCTLFVITVLVFMEVLITFLREIFIAVKALRIAIGQDAKERCIITFWRRCKKARSGENGVIIFPRNVKGLGLHSTLVFGPYYFQGEVKNLVEIPGTDTFVLSLGRARYDRSLTHS